MDPPTASLAGPRTPSLQQFLQWIRRPIPYLEECSRRFGDAFLLRFPFYPPVALFCHPRAVRDVFADPDGALHAGEANSVFAPVLGAASVLVVDGEPHHHARRALTNPVGRESWEDRTQVVQAIVESALGALPIGRSASVLRTMQSLTLDVLFYALIGLRPGTGATRLREHLHALLAMFERPSAMVTLWICQRDLGPLTPWRRVQRHLHAARALLHHELKEARGRKGTTRSLIESLAATDRPCAGHLSDSALVDQLMTILISGHETLAPTLAWALSWLDREPEAGGRLRSELRDLPAGRGRLASPHLDAFVKESMRLSPVIITVGRLVRITSTIAGVTVPAGTVIAPCVYLTHRHPDVWEQPARFRPQRFIDRRPTAHEFYPFGGGLRHCVGADFALMTVKATVAEVVCRDDIAFRGIPTAVRRGTSIVPSLQLEMAATAPGAAS